MFLLQLHRALKYFIIIIFFVFIAFLLIFNYQQKSSGVSFVCAILQRKKKLFFFWWPQEIAAFCVNKHLKIFIYRHLFSVTVTAAQLEPDEELFFRILADSLSA